MGKCRVAAPIRQSVQCITLRAEFNKDDFQNSRTFHGSSKILTKIQGTFKDFKDRHEIQGFQGFFFQACGNPDILSNVQLNLLLTLKLVRQHLLCMNSCNLPLLCSQSQKL